MGIGALEHNMNNNKCLLFGKPECTWLGDKLLRSISGFILLSITCLPTVKGQGRFVESLVKLRSSLEPQKFQ